MKKLLAIAMVLAIAAVVINDAGAYLSTWNTLGQQTTEIAIAAARAARATRGDRQIGGRAAIEAATAKGVTVYGYDQNQTLVHVWTQVPVQGTFVLARAHNLLSRQPLDTPYYIKDDDTSFID